MAKAFGKVLQNEQKSYLIAFVMVLLDVILCEFKAFSKAGIRIKRSHRRDYDHCQRQKLRDCLLLKNGRTTKKLEPKI